MPDTLAGTLAFGHLTSRQFGAMRRRIVRLPITRWIEKLGTKSLFREDGSEVQIRLGANRFH
jgi:hypothetical protein